MNGILSARTTSGFSVFPCRKDACLPKRIPGASQLSQSSTERWLATSGRRRMLSARGSKRFFQGWTGDWLTVVGIVGDVIYNRDGVRLPVFYCPERQWYFTERQVIVRTRGDPSALIATVRQTLQSIDPDITSDQDCNSG